MAENESSDHYYLTLDDADENHVLELVWVSGEHYHIRDNGTWFPVDPDAENDRIWDRVIVDVSADAAQEFDLAERENPLDITREQFEDYELEEELA